MNSWQISSGQTESGSDVISFNAAITAAKGAPNVLETKQGDSTCAVARKSVVSQNLRLFQQVVQIHKVINNHWLAMNEYLDLFVGKTGGYFYFSKGSPHDRSDSIGDCFGNPHRKWSTLVIGNGNFISNISGNDIIGFSFISR